MTTPQRRAKEREVDELADKLGRSQMAILTDYRGLRVSDLQNLRGRLRGVGVEYAVAKNTLTRFAAERVGREAMVQDLTGPTAIAFVYDDPSAATRAIQDFIRATRSPLKIKGGVLGNSRLSAEEVGRLADLPGKDELRARLVGTFSSPMAGLVGAMNGLLSSLAYTLDQRVQQLEGGAEAAA